mmetsp:Transcript_26359/g.76853  ORF Transcript_26359/g.76853 Transcript_26359/m.76853 type:complete len:242 (+) Transcript_26359:322-1047(+)
MVARAQGVQRVGPPTSDQRPVSFAQSSTANSGTRFVVDTIPRLGLVCHFFLCLLDLIRVSEEVSLKQTRRTRIWDGLEVLVEPVHKGDASRDLQPRDIVIADVIKHFENSPNRVAVGCHEHGLPPLESGHNGAFPVWQGPFHSVLEAFAQRNVLLADVGVLVVVARPVFAGSLDGGGGGRKGPTPLLHLVVTVLGHSFTLIQPCQSPVHALVEAPVGIDRDMLLAGDLKHNVQSLLGTLEQ